MNQWTTTQINRVRQQVTINNRRKHMSIQYKICAALTTLVVFTLLTTQHLAKLNKEFDDTHLNDFQTYEVLCENGEGELNRYSYVSTKQESYAYEVSFCDSMHLLETINKEVK